MKPTARSLFPALLLVPVFLTASLLLGQRPIPPGIREADRADAQMEKDMPPPIMGRAKVNFVKLSEEAEELAKIAQTIPPSVASVQKGMLPKDLNQRLKQVEKLSKRLRSELEP